MPPRKLPTHGSDFSGWNRTTSPSRNSCSPRSVNDSAFGPYGGSPGKISKRIGRTRIQLHDHLVPFLAMNAKGATLSSGMLQKKPGFRPAFLHSLTGWASQRPITLLHLVRIHIHVAAHLLELRAHLLHPRLRQGFGGQA